MIVNLRAKLKEAAKETPKPQPQIECLVRDERFPFPEADALRAVTARDLRRLGLETAEVSGNFQARPVILRAARVLSYRAAGATVAAPHTARG